MFRNIPPVTKNLLLLNIMFFVVSYFLRANGNDISGYLSAHYFNSVLFQPYQVVTHMFMHNLNDILHILFNMLLLVMFGGHLERIWGGKRYFIFYIACGLGALVLFNSIGVFQIIELKREILTNSATPIESINEFIKESANNGQFSFFGLEPYDSYAFMNYSQISGASGAVFGLLAGFALLFPNTELMLIFLPVPIKAKYLIGAYLAFEVYNSIFKPNDQIAHLAHVGGAVVGIIIILIWRKRDRTNFY